MGPPGDGGQIEAPEEERAGRSDRHGDRTGDHEPSEEMASEEQMLASVPAKRHDDTGGKMIGRAGGNRGGLMTMRRDDSHEQRSLQFTGVISALPYVMRPRGAAVMANSIAVEAPPI